MAIVRCLLFFGNMRGNWTFGNAGTGSANAYYEYDTGPATLDYRIIVESEMTVEAGSRNGLGDTLKVRSPISIRNKF